MGKMTPDDIRNKLHGLVRDRLFGGGPWEADEVTNAALYQQFLSWGLIKEYPEYGADTFGCTALGAEVDLDLFQCFIGLHHPPEIPDVLELCGAISKEEANNLIFVRFEQNGEKPEDVLPPILRKIYTERFGAEQGVTPTDATRGDTP